MKKNKHNRRISALARLEDQITTHRMSREFHDSIVDLPNKEKEKAIVSYWDRKVIELETLKKKIG